jgi:phosphoribosylformimino-5-aminoimidazole carboxamide ribotide isomerase
MKLYPAIDLLNGKIVRLKQGDFKQLTTYEEDPIKIAKKYQDDGAKNLHVIDLNGAASGKRDNDDILKMLIKETNLNIQVGGGIRSFEQAEMLLKMGVNKVIIGTMAVESIKILIELVQIYKGKIIVSLDANDEQLAIKGWQSKSSINAIEFCKTLEEIGIETIVYTDISRDGMMMGPNFSIYERLKQETNLKIIASGGISSLNDLKRLNAIGLYGTIIGKALYEKTFSLKEAYQCLQDESFLV